MGKLDDLITDYESDQLERQTNRARFFELMAKTWLGNRFLTELQPAETEYDDGQFRIPVTFGTARGFVRGKIGQTGELILWDSAGRESKTLVLPVDKDRVAERVDLSTLAQFLISVRDWT